MAVFARKKKSDNQAELSKLPEHVAIIMDGNGRWAKKRMLPRVAGHRAGMGKVKTIIKMSSDIGIKHLTLYAFSTENWKRPKEEVSALMGLLIEYLRKELMELHENNVVFKTLGDIKMLPVAVVEVLNEAIEKTKDNTGMVLNIALNYGSRAEILQAVRSIAEDCANGALAPGEIDESLLSNRLETKGQPDPDFLIRTSGEQRLSNYLLYQMAYAELYFTDAYWPDFGEEEYVRALKEFEKRQRRFGGL